jgi:hypothetical protein
MKLFRLTDLINVVFLFVASMAAQVGGGGTVNHLPLWTGTTNLGNSVVVQQNGNIGIGNSSPVAILDVTGKPGTSSNGGNAPTAVQMVGGAGSSLQAGSTLFAAGGTGSILLITGGTAATCVFTGMRCGNYTGGNGGSITFQPGSGGKGAFASGHPGKITLAPNGGKVGVGTSSPSAGFEVGAGRSTLADTWTTRSSRRFKTNIHPLVGALAKVEQLQGVSYERKLDHKAEIGVIAEDVDHIVPEIVSRNPDSKQIEGVDYAKLSALLIEAVKSQQRQIEQLQIEVLQLKSTGLNGISTKR